MKEDVLPGTVHLGTRTIPVPKSISPKAQEFLITMAAAPAVEFPATSDKVVWQAFIKARDEKMKQVWATRAEAAKVSLSEDLIRGVPIYYCRPDEARASIRDRLVLEFHGGGFVFMGGDGSGMISKVSAHRFGCVVVAVDYRMPPLHPYPAAIDDALAVYRHFISVHDPRKIVVMGSSAGGNIAASLVLRARDEGLPMPGCAVLFSPQIDLTESGDSFQTHLGIDVSLKRGLGPVNELYANGQDMHHPYLSPLFGDFSYGFPPTLVQSGTRDLFLSNAARLHQSLRRANVEADLHVLEALPHGRFSGAPEDADFANEVVKFIERH